MFDNGLFTEIFRYGITPDDFKDPRCKTILFSMIRLEIDNERIDLVTLIGDLRARGELEKIGGGRFLVGMMDPFDEWSEYANKPREVEKTASDTHIHNPS